LWFGFSSVASFSIDQIQGIFCSLAVQKLGQAQKIALTPIFTQLKTKNAFNRQKKPTEKLVTQATETHE